MASIKPELDWHVPPPSIAQPFETIKPAFTVYFHVPHIKSDSRVQVQASLVVDESGGSSPSQLGGQCVRILDAGVKKRLVIFDGVGAKLVPGRFRICVSLSVWETRTDDTGCQWRECTDLSHLHSRPVLVIGNPKFLKLLAR